MITDTEPVRRPRHQLLSIGLPLQEPMPLHVVPPSGAAPATEGPLALDYRTWGIDMPLPQRAAADDVTYTTTATLVSYDGKGYYYAIVDKVDEK